MNKIKEHPFDLNRRALTQKFPTIRCFIETDCEDGSGIEDLIQRILRETDQLEHLRDAFPASWFSIKDHLAGMKENFLTFDRYRELCSESGELDQRAQDSLAFYLHNLGIALNYKDDPRLRDMHVLNPHWVTNGIYRILNADALAGRKGELVGADLTEILDPKEYPPERHGFLLELMRKFELCFAFPESHDRYLIPELLDKQEPAVAADYDPDDCLSFQYEYPILPSGLLPRFIVRTHVLSTNLQRWRTGVILEFEGNRALVKADVQDKRVLILVSGPTSGRRRLLAIIRSDFEHIHRSFNFTPQGMVAAAGYPQVLVSYEELLVMERSGVETFPKVLGTEVLRLNVRDLLSGVDLEGAREIDWSDYTTVAPIHLFYSYSHKDEDLREELETHLKIMERQGLIDSWNDRRITAGQDWKGKIDEHLERSHIILMLISPDFFASDYCYEVELSRALEKQDAGEAFVIPVLVRDVNWRSSPLAKLQALPVNGNAVTTWDNRDSAWRNVAEGIETVAKRIKGKVPD